jgi:hypothetical protein
MKKPTIKVTSTARPVGKKSVSVTTRVSVGGKTKTTTKTDHGK